jgi:DNA-binding SARP family transcriptional activator/Tfp pilus assembly protein PilF
VAPETEFCLLGSLMVRYRGIAIAVPPGKQRALLAALLLNAGRLVTVDDLVEVLWGSSPPPSARPALKTYVMRLRKTLAGAAQPLISTRPGGYLITVGRGELDVDRFETLAAAARAAEHAGSWADAAAMLRSALSLWRGEPLADVPSDTLVRRELPRLAEMRLTAIEACAAADLRLGRHGDVVIELRRLAAVHPLRERLHALLMLALYRDGRQGEALAVYQQARRSLIDELGAEPGPGLRELQRQILVADPALAAPALAAPARPEVIGDPSGPARSPAEKDRAEKGVSPAVPRLLPAAAPHFAGRADQLTALNGMLELASRSEGTVVIAAVSGTAGVGKTALAVHWAHQVTDRFPDGQLYIDLRGFDPVGPPVDVASALRRFLDALGVSAARIPASVDAQIDLYRSQMAGKRLLVVLDNARDAGQVRPLLPGTSGGMVLVTSRDQLASLIALEGARPLTVDLLGPGESRELMVRRLGAARVAAEPETAEELISLCARLPLALNIAAAHVELHPQRPLGALVSELRDARRRLDVLASEDSAADVRAVFSWSYRRLSDEAARLFRLLGAHPGPDITVAASASLIALGRDQARHLLAELTSAHLLTEHLLDRYTFHDLLRAYATERSHDSDVERQHALRRVMDHYQRSAAGAAALLRPGWQSHGPATLHDGVIPETVQNQQQAHQWFQAEKAVLLAVTGAADDAGLDQQVVGIATALGTFLELTKEWQAWEWTEQTALNSARRSGDLRGEANAHAGLGKLLATRGSYPQAHTHLETARAVRNRLGDQALESNTELSIAITFGMEQRFSEALDHIQRAAALCPPGDGHRMARILNAHGWFHAGLGQNDQALALCQQALALAGALGDTSAEAGILDSLGYIHQRLGRYGESDDELARAAELRRALGERFDLAKTLARLGDTRHAVGDDSARKVWGEAAEILDELQLPDAEQVRRKIAELP